MQKTNSNKQQAATGMLEDERHFSGLSDTVGAHQQQLEFLFF